ncbi:MULTISPECIES: accessory Sec system S-layer assembly protein [unclassified Bacillus cereus group]|uniref:accessory Sec system S-layer assembly protein n=1 Tax=unclassified Bacillus cereus group TaxID=2750818 RepID=UPI001F57F43A|nr:MULTISPECIES: accessory Sec system S-layer assembly protein [unclassified Bacillus cereus group]
MLSFLKRAKKKGKDTTVSSNELLGQEEASSPSKNVKPTLYFHPAWGEVAQEQQYIYRFLHKELPQLQENQLSLSGIEVEKQDNGYNVIAFIRSNVSKPIQFDTFTLLLSNKEGEVCARKTFDFSTLGEIPANVNMPWVFTFEQETLTSASLSETDWELAFELKGEHRLDLDPTWETQLPAENKEALQKLVEDLTPPNEGELNFLGIQAQQMDTGDLHTTILIRNGLKQTIQLEQLPLNIIDASQEVIATGTFTLPNLKIQANTTKPWSFTFPASLVTKKSVDLSTWKVIVPQE